jgi:hypothetical protein
MKTFFSVAGFTLVSVCIAFASTVGAFADDDNDACKEELESCRAVATPWSCFEKCAKLKSKSCEENCERVYKERFDECLTDYKVCTDRGKSPSP